MDKTNPDANASTPPSPKTNNSTLIEFPGAARAAARPQWRKELSAKVREIQQKRALEAAQEAANETTESLETNAETSAERTNAPSAALNKTNSAPLGLVPPPAAQPVNPLVAAALKRIERARMTPPPSVSRGVRSGRASAAAAFVADLETETPEVARQETAQAQPAPHAQLSPVVAPTPASDAASETPRAAERKLETTRAVTLTVVAPPPAETKSETKSETPPAELKQTQQTIAPPKETEREVSTVSSSTATPTTESRFSTQAAEAERLMREAASKPKPRRVIEGVIDDAYLLRREAEKLTHAEETRRNEYAPLFSRAVGGVFDLIVAAALAAPAAYFIHRTNGDWRDLRVAGALAGVFALTIILYTTIALTLVGKTIGQKLFKLQTVNAETGMTPGFGRSLVRAFAYVVALAACGFGVLYSLIDAEGRGLHDHIAGTIVVKE